MFKSNKSTLGETMRLWVLPLPNSLGSWKARCSSDAEFSLSSLEECRRDTMGRKGVKGFLLVGHEKVPCDFGLRTRDPSDTADGAGNQERPVRWARITRKNQGLPEPQTSIYFPEIQYPRPGKGGKEGLCVFVHVLRDFGILMKTLSLLLNLCNFWINNSFPFHQSLTWRAIIPWQWARQI